MDLLSGSVADLHAREPDWSGRQVWVMEVERPALVLGSAQRRDLVDEGAVELGGLDVVSRRSGGGAVLVDQNMLWVDFLIGRDDPLWHDDVGVAFDWVGTLWAEVLGACGVANVAVHSGALEPGVWGRTICFVSLGPGEVRVGDQKVVGISQRRTRGGARFQCSVLCAGGDESQAAIPDLLALDAADRSAAKVEVGQRVGAVSATRAEVLESLTNHLGAVAWMRS